MGMIPSNLGTLVEQLEDARQFHALAAEVSDGIAAERHRERAHGYAAMLSEIRQWESDACNEIVDLAATSDDSDCPGPEDSYMALMSRISHMHGALMPRIPPLQKRATGDAMEGGATEGHRRAGAPRG